MLTAGGQAELSEGSDGDPTQDVQDVQVTSGQHREGQTLLYGQRDRELGELMTDTSID